MTYEDFDALIDTDYNVETMYMEYIMENCYGDRVIGNGDDLIIASEQGYLYEEFRDYYIETQTRDYEADADRNDYERSF